MSQPEDRRPMLERRHGGAGSTGRPVTICPRASNRPFVTRGGLMSYGSGRTDQNRRAPARPFGMHLLAAGAGIRKTLPTAPFENPINTRLRLFLISHTEIS
jgi:hypothetical protein